ncbi:MAG: endolytic transglycosylase MltG [Myxococcota bacterium]
MAPEKPGFARAQVPDRETWLKTLGGVFTRVVLFGIEGTNAKITGVRGLSDLLIGQTTSLADQTPLRWAIEAASPVVGAGRSPSGEIMAHMLKLAVPRAFAVVPLMSGKKLAGLAYGDCGNQALPLASVSEVFSACEKLLNPSRDKSALPDKGSIRSTSRRDSRDLRKPKPRASRRLDVQVLFLSEVIDEEPPSAPLPSPRDTVESPPPMVLPPPPPAPVTRGQPREPEPSPRERGFRRGKRRKTRPVERPFLEPEVAPPQALARPREPLPQRTRSPAPTKPEAKPAPAPRPKPAAHLAKAPPFAPPDAWSNPPDLDSPETQLYSLKAFEAAELVGAEHAPFPPPRGDARVIQAVRSRYSGPHPLVVFAVTLAMCLAILAVLSPPASEGMQERVVTVPSGASAQTIGGALKEAKLVRSSIAFTILGELTRTRGLRAGSYRVTTGSWPWQVAAQLRGGQDTLLDLVIPEGASLPEVAKRMEAAGVADATAFTEASRAPQLLSRHGIVAIDSQGWLAPGAYAMARGISAVDAMSVMVERFKAQLATLPETNALSAEALNQVMVLASLVEKEAKDKSEARRIAGLFHNRLKLNMRLESRATVLYILGEDKKEMTLADVRAPSPYNTYLNAGLPPGPIATPSIEALRAALHPEEHGYFYMTDRDDGAGAHVFSITYEDHLKAQRENR